MMASKSNPKPTPQFFPHRPAQTISAAVKASQQHVQTVHAKSK
jgi:hypothetical protein